jgi:hypothetical protein
MKFKLALLSIVFCGLASTAQACPLPKVLGRISNPQGKALYQVKSGADTYSLWEVTTKQGSFDTVLKQDSQGHCYVAFTDPGGDAETMTKGVPQRVAQTFALKTTQDAIKRMGKSNLQAALNKMGPDDIVYPENRDAYASLGLTLPPGVRISAYWTGPLQQMKYR